MRYLVAEAMGASTRSSLHRSPRRPSFSASRRPSIFPSVSQVDMCTI